MQKEDITKMEKDIQRSLKTVRIDPNDSIDVIVKALLLYPQQINTIDADSDLMRQIIGKLPEFVNRVKNASDDLWIHALTAAHYPYNVFKLCVDPSDAIVLAYAKTKNCLVSYIPYNRRSYDVCVAVVSTAGINLKFVPMKYRYEEKLLRSALLTSRDFIFHVPIDALSESFCNDYVKKYPDAFGCLPVQYASTCAIAIEESWENMQYVWEPTAYMNSLAAITKYGYVNASKSLESMKLQDEMSIERAAQIGDGSHMKSVRHQTREQCIAAYKQNAASAVHFDPTLFPKLDKKITVEDILSASVNLSLDEKASLMQSLLQNM